MNIFLRMKAWQIFGLMVIIPFGFQIFIMITAFNTTELNFNAIFTILPAFMLIFMTLFLAWLWALGTRLNNYISDKIKPSPTIFKFGIIYSFIYMALFLIFFVSLSTNGIGNNHNPASFMAIILPLHLLAMSFMFYGIYFISKNLLMAEQQTLIKPAEIIGPFVFLWFFPIGVWFLQPRINTLYIKNKG